MSFYDNARGSSSSGTEIYASFGRVFNWAYNHREDTTYGHCYTDLKAAFEKIAKFFDGTIQVQAGLGPGKYYDPQGRTQVINDEVVPLILSMPIICNKQDIEDYFTDNFDIRQVYYPLFYRPYETWYGDKDKGLEKICNKVCGRIDRFCKFNKFKYIRLLQILNYEYNPIENYNMVENGADTTARNGSVSVAHTIAEGTQFKQTKISGPASAGTGTGETEPTFDFSKKIKEVVAQTGDTYQGRIGDTPSISDEGVPSASTANGTAVKDEHYTTTYDDDTTGRLQSYDTSEGSVATTQKGVSEKDLPIVKEEIVGNPNAYGYTDETTYTDDGDTKDHSLTRKGNIGVMTTQQMIEQERLVVEGFNLVEQFLEELSKEIFLAVYS